MGLFTKSSSKCGICHKYTCRCSRNGKGTPQKAKVKVENKHGKTVTVTRNTGNTVRNGIVWCSCGCRVNNGRCSNVQCSRN